MRSIENCPKGHPESKTGGTASRHGQADQPRPSRATRANQGQAGPSRAKQGQADQPGPTRANQGQAGQAGPSRAKQDQPGPSRVVSLKGSRLGFFTFSENDQQKFYNMESF